jgi:hypothetical protein
MLVYLASEDPTMVRREQRVMPGDRDWPECRPGQEHFPG